MVSTILVACLIEAGTPDSAQGAAWPVERRWTATEEATFSRWVSDVGQNVWRSVNHLVRDRARNWLFDESDLRLRLYADCADFPVILRAYFAYKRRLPFAVTEVAGGRYSRRGNRTAKVYDNLSFSGSVQAFFSLIPQVLHSGCYRTPPAATDSLTYPVAIAPGTLRPGVVFYSPEGHVGIVAEVTAEGEVYLLDAHPDQTVTRIRFSPKLPWSSSGAGLGGFKAFRPASVRAGKVILVGENPQVPGFSTEQYGFSDYYGEVRRRLARRNADPLESFDRFVKEDVFREVLDRVRAVDLGWAVGRRRAIAVPPNIYTAEGDWEMFSTPSRDLRLRRAFLQVPEEIRRHLRGRNPRERKKLGRALLRRKRELFHGLRFSYQNSDGAPVRLTLAEVEKRLFRLSFNPNHPPELRWGAEGLERATAPRNAVRYYASFESEQRWRNRLVKKSGPMSTADADNPPAPPFHDLDAMIEAAVAGSTARGDGS
jgi:hypothetical protein